MGGGGGGFHGKYGNVSGTEVALHWQVGGGVGEPTGKVNHIETCINVTCTNAYEYYTNI